MNEFNTMLGHFVIKEEYPMIPKELRCTFSNDPKDKQKITNVNYSLTTGTVSTYSTVTMFVCTSCGRQTAHPELNEDYICREKDRRKDIRRKDDRERLEDEY